MPARNGSAAAAAAGKATFGSIGDTSRVTAERIATTLYSAAGVEWGELSEAIRRREIVIAHELAVKGASPAEAAAFVAWCQAGEHRPNVTSMRTYENHRATFRMKSAAVSHSTAGDGSDLGNGRAIG